MKKLVICLAIATVAVSCKKVPQGGNKATLKLEEGVERYSDDHQGGKLTVDMKLLLNTKKKLQSLKLQLLKPTALPLQSLLKKQKKLRKLNTNYQYKI